MISVIKTALRKPFADTDGANRIFIARVRSVNWLCIISAEQCRDTLAAADRSIS